MKEIIAAIVILGSIFLVLFKKLWSSDAEVRELKKRLRMVRKYMRLAVTENRSDDWSVFNSERMQLLKKLRDLR